MIDAKYRYLLTETEYLFAKNDCCKNEITNFARLSQLHEDDFVLLV